MGLDRLTKDGHIFHRRIEGLVPASLLVVDIFANDPPVLHLEGLFAKNLVGIVQAVEDKTMAALLVTFLTFCEERAFLTSELRPVDLFIV